MFFFTEFSTNVSLSWYSLVKWGRKISVLSEYKTFSFVGRLEFSFRTSSWSELSLNKKLLCTSQTSLGSVQLYLSSKDFIIQCILDVIYCPKTQLIVWGIWLHPYWQTHYTMGMKSLTVSEKKLTAEWVFVVPAKRLYFYYTRGSKKLCDNR